MSLVQYNRGFAPKSFSSMLDNFFDESVTNRKVAGFQPKVDIKETENAFEVHAALPGLKKENINVQLDENKLTISGERKIEKKEDKDNYHLVETQYGSFSRSFFLPDNIATDKIEAEFKDGMLGLIIPKDEKAKLNKAITIK